MYKLYTYITSQQFLYAMVKLLGQVAWFFLVWFVFNALCES